MNEFKNSAFYFGHALGVFSLLDDQGENKAVAVKDALNLITSTKEFLIMSGRDCIFASSVGDFSGFLQTKEYAESEIGLPAGMKLVCVLKNRDRVRFALTHVFPALVA
jgi:hypothetical protein